MAWEVIKKIVGNMLEEPISLHELENWFCTRCGRTLWYLGQMGESRINHEFVCQPCNRKYVVTTESILNPKQISINIGYGEGESFSSLLETTKRSIYDQLVQNINSGKVSGDEIKSNLEQGILSPFDLPVSLYNAFEPESMLPLQIKFRAQNIIDRQYEKLRNELFEKLGVKTLVLYDDEVVYASSLTPRLSEKELEEVIEREKEKFCFTWGQDRNIEEEVENGE